MTERFRRLPRRAARIGLRPARAVANRLRMRRARLLAARVPHRERRVGWIDVVMPVRDVADYVDESIRSVLSQSHWRVNLVVVDDDSADDTARRVQRWVERDSRVRLLSTVSHDPNAARNLALAQTDAEFLAFLDGDDVLLEHAYRDLHRRLAASGSDFIAGSYDRLADGVRTPAAFWIGDAHAIDHDATTAERSPAMLVNAVQWSKLYRRSFWDAEQLAFPEGGHFNDQIVSARAYAAASAFDVMRRPVVSWRVRSDGSSMTQQLVSPAQIADRFRTSNAALAVLAAEGSPALARHRRVQFLENDLGIAAGRLPDMGDEAYGVLRDGLAAFVPATDEAEIRRLVPSAMKVLFHLVMSDDRASAEAFIQRGGLDLLRHRPVSIGGRVHVRLPFWDDAAAGVPVECFEASPRDLRFLREAGLLETCEVLQSPPARVPGPVTRELEQMLDAAASETEAAPASV
ncbi:CDP-glycerol glycerophosphotransferase [Agromyces terreus]|uniref:CDP-glycerol glycerophosphotransferase n=1 Tax=Agromyces terreus TaxID=424795 RepID=A0A9X2H2E4_9MICO|nr:glycosyltransferase family A protein [Agromyces terreus]MCP2371328.1 CDP-glycerol glycerophosphotransferase [Agromyces terreus]